MNPARRHAAVLSLYAAGSLGLSACAAWACPDGAGAMGCGHECGTSDCGAGTGHAPSSPDSGERGGPPFAISAVEFTFLPNTPIIKPETTVRWTNASTAFQHNTVRFGMWESPVLFPGEVFDFRFTGANAGFDYFYECSIHPGMEGHVNVAHFGDANLDGTVNLNDFNVLASNFGQTNSVWEQGDFNEDGTVNLNDFNLLAANFGKTIQPAPPSAAIAIVFGDAAGLVPEPSSVIALLLAPLIASRRRRGRARA